MQMGEGYDWSAWDAATAEYEAYRQSTANNSQAGSSSVDWTGLVNNALNVWGAVERGAQQAEVAKAQAQYSYRYPTLTNSGALTLPGGTLSYPKLLNPITGQPVAQQNDTWFILAAVGIVGAAFFFSRK